MPTQETSKSSSEGKHFKWHYNEATEFVPAGVFGSTASQEEADNLAKSLNGIFKAQMPGVTPKPAILRT